MRPHDSLSCVVVRRVLINALLADRDESTM